MAKGQVTRVDEAKVHIIATFNNTKIFITDLSGNLLAWSSAGDTGYANSKKSTPFAASRAAKKVAEKAQNYKIQKVMIFIQGPGAGRESAIRAISESFQVVMISDITGIPHNGCRAEKERRV